VRYIIVLFWGLLFIVSSYIVVASLPSASQLESAAMRFSIEPDDYKPSDSLKASSLEEVLISKKYGIYHRSGCSWAPAESKRCRLKEAVDLGYEPCPYCW